MTGSAVTSVRALVFSGKAAARRRAFAIVALVAAGTAQPAAALVIRPVFDSSITSLANASTIQAAFNTVVQDFTSQFTSNAQINVQVSWGSVGGHALSSGAVASTLSSLYGYYTYGQVKSRLTSAAQSNPSNTSLAMAVANLPATAPAGPASTPFPHPRRSCWG